MAAKAKRRVQREAGPHVSEKPSVAALFFAAAVPNWVDQALPGNVGRALAPIQQERPGSMDSFGLSVRAWRRLIFSLTHVPFA